MAFRCSLLLISVYFDIVLSVCYEACDWSALQAPINDDKATSVLIGLSLESTKEHIVRAVVESLAFRFNLLYEMVLYETKTCRSSLIKYELLVLHGDFQCRRICRVKKLEMSD